MLAAPIRDPLAGLNDAQRAAVEHDASPLLVIAGAGSGKTNTLAHRVAHLVLQGADAKRIMLATFSRRAAAELSRRVEQILRRDLGPEAAAAATPAYAGTFHAIGARLLREYSERIGLDAKFTIHDREDSADLMNYARHAAGLSEKTERFPTKATCVAIYSRVVNARAPLSETLGRRFPWAAAHEGALTKLFAAYVEAKQAQNVLDYDDLLLYLAQALQEPALAAEIAGRFDHLLVDEYQDTNALQAEIALKLRPDGRGLTVVGDDAQSIYSFRAAEVRNILEFPARFEPAARVVALERNYRSTAPILAASNAVIALSPERLPKTLFTEKTGGAPPLLVTVGEETDQARYVATRVLGQPRGGIDAEKPSGAVPNGEPFRSAGAGTDPPQHPVRKIRRLEVLGRGACEGRSGAAALCREPARPGCGISRDAASARRRPRPRRAHGRRRGRRGRVRDARRLRGAGEGARGFRRVRGARAARRDGALAERLHGDAGLAARDAGRRLRRRRAARRRSRRAGAHRRDLPFPRTFP